MVLTTYDSAADYLVVTQEMLEAEEVVNGLMLGICLRLVRDPNRYGTLPYLATVEDDDGIVMAAAMTPPHKLLVASPQHDLGQAPALIVRDLLANGWTVPGVLGPAHIADTFAAAWGEIAGQPYEEEMRQRVFQLTAVKLPKGTPGRLRAAVHDDLDLVAEWAFHFTVGIFGEGDREGIRRSVERRIAERGIYLWEDGQPVSVAARSRSTRSTIAVNLVYTPPEFRRRGYATACVAHLSQLLLDQGWRSCTLFTDLANSTSNHIYQEIGYVPVCDFNEYVFPKEATVRAKR